MKLLCITDLHSRRSALRRIMEAAGPVDTIILGGDLTNFGTPAEAEDLIRCVRQTGANVLAVAGNCDSEAIDSRLSELGVSLFRRGVLQEQVGFYGVSAMPPWLGTMYHLTEEEIADALRAGRAQVGRATQEVVVSHAPPRATLLDRTAGGEHVGSSAVREFIDSVQPDLVVCGHIHESRGIDQLGETIIVNCGPAHRGHYVVANVNESIQVELRSV